VAGATVHRIRRGVFHNNYTCNDTQFGLNTGNYFALDMLPNYTEFTNMFDQYRIVEIEVLITPTFTTADMSIPTGGSVVCPQVMTVLDFNDSTPLTTDADYLQRMDTLKMTIGTVEHRRKFTPRMAALAYAGATSGYTVQPRDSWLDCSYPNIRHYGIKTRVTPAGATGTGWMYRVFHFFTVELKYTL